METSPTSPPRRRGRIAAGLLRGGTHWLVVGSLIGGFAAYVFQVIGARALGEEAYAPISTLWTIQYLCWSIFLYAVETLVNREVVLGRIGERMETGIALRLVGALVGGAIVVTGGAWLARGALFYGFDDLALVAGAVVLGFGAFAVVRGRLAGTGRFRAYGLVTAAESTLRLALAAGVVGLAAATRPLAWTLPAGAAAAAAFWVVLGRRHRGAPEVDPDQLQPPRAGRFLALTTASNAVVQLLLAGAPLVVVALGARPAEVSMVFITVTAARVPVVLALGGLLSRMLPAFVHILEDHGDAMGVTLARRIAGATLLLGGVAGAAGALVGGPLVALFFGEGFTPPSWFAAATGTGVVLATGGMLLNQLLVARGLEHRLVAPWYGALLAAALAIFVTSGSPSYRVAIAFVVGELVAILALTLAAGRSLARPQSG
jgi:O-antigen/teichoic acid export membrane protein